MSDPVLDSLIWRIPESENIRGVTWKESYYELQAELAAAEQRSKFSHDNLMIVEKDRQAARDEIVRLREEKS